MGCKGGPSEVSSESGICRHIPTDDDSGQKGPCTRYSQISHIHGLALKALSTTSCPSSPSSPLTSSPSSPIPLTPPSPPPSAAPAWPVGSASSARPGATT
eukprot:765778-Hanusia_phi.AAC.1